MAPDGLERLELIRRARDRFPLPKRVEEMFEAGHLRSEYIDHRPATRVLTRYHER